MRSLLLLSALGALASVPAVAQVAPAAPKPATPAVPSARPVLPARAPEVEVRHVPEAWVVDAPIAMEAATLLAEAPLLALESASLAAEAMRLDADAALLHLEAATLAAEAPLAHMALEPLTLVADEMHFTFPPAVEMRGLPAHAPAGWASSDPADSLYRSARETLNRSEYRRAAQLFRQVRDRYPRSEYVSEAAYWEAFALYRIGTTDDLRSGLAVLDRQGSFTRKETQANAKALRTRILGALARRGDSGARVLLDREAANGEAACDSEDLMVRVEALNALSQLDQAAAMPLFRRVLARHDECSASLRRSAVSLAARRGGADALPLLTEVATSDPSSSVRSMAASTIGSIEGEAATAALESMLRAPDENVRRGAARALGRRTDPRARRALRSYLESPQTSDAHKAEVIHGFGKENVSADDVAYLRALFARTDSDQIRSAIITVLPRIAPDESRQWLVSLARDPNQPTSIRSAAISSISRDESVPAAELTRIYDAASERRIREHLVMALGRREDPAATDKLVDIARNGTDPVVRSAAINQLTRNAKKDPRLAAVLQELIDR